MRILLKIAYLGTDYHGWQVQPNGITVQEVMQDALEKLYGVRLPLTGCSRTDAGVHANEFCCHYDTDMYIPANGIVNALNSKLPSDISVLSAAAVSDEFHARYSSIGKNYVYRIYNSRVHNPFFADRSWRIPYELDITKMNIFLSGIIGTHDFIAFSASGRTVKDTVRTVKECSIEKKGDFIELSVTADGFLYNMVRIIVGTAIDVSNGKISEHSAKEILVSKKRELAGITAPPHGLFLNKVLYPEVIFDD